MEPTTDVDVSQIRRDLDDRGYTVLPEMVDRTALAALDRTLVAAYESFPKFSGGGMISGHLNCYPGEAARFVYDTLVERGVADAMVALRPGRRCDVRATLNFNLPGSAPQHYHMDGLYVEDFLVCNIAVVDTSLENGAIDVLPGTNREFYPFWRYATTRQFRRTTRLPMRAGDLLIRRSTLWHRGMPNKTAAPRPLMSLTFGEASAPEGDPFSMGAEPVFYPNWFSTGRLSRVRERLFVAAPISYSAFRFAKSLTGNRGYEQY
jgi:Phytanoyl-CoA dioxygenase (PhyH)